MEKKITVFTPTYNRRILIENCYRSLQRQTCKDFVWLVIDDGSTDGTEDYIEQLKVFEKNFEIKYFKKGNGGLASTYNEAINLIETELFLCVDSDDYLTDDAVELVINYYSMNKNIKVCGLIGYNRRSDGELIGVFPDMKSIHLSTLITKYHFRKDFKIVYETKIAKAYLPIPILQNEKDMNPVYLMLRIDRDYEVLILNKPLCVVNYQHDGMTANILVQYTRSPNSFAELRKLYLSIEQAGILFKFRHCVHYVSSSFLAKKIRKYYQECPNKLLYAISFFPGFLLFILITLMQGHHYPKR